MDLRNRETVGMGWETGDNAGMDWEVGEGLGRS